MAEVETASRVYDLIQKLAPAIKDGLGLICGVGEEMDKLSTTLANILCVLADAEQRQITDQAVKNWLAQLKNVAYDAEDLLEEFAYEDLRHKLTEHDHTITKVFNFFLSYLLLRPIRFRRIVACRIKEINNRLDIILRDGERFRLKKGDGEIQKIPDQRLPSSSLIPKDSHSDFVGRDDDIEQIMALLIPDEDASVGGGGKHVSVISIVGLGGLGKTTLAQLVYNHENVQKHFQVRAWVCVSDHFDISKLTKEIIESATGKSCKESAFDLMQCKLKDILSGKRFLIVLDDVWNTKRSAWDRLRPPFSYGAEGSKIIVTTRDEAVSRNMDTDYFYPLELLSDDDCLSLLLRHAFVGENCNAHPELMEIGKDLVERHCQGLPLAAKVLGGLLSSKSDINFWRSILNSDLWISNEGESEVMKVLRVSYHHFPPHIKQCFAFCSVLPKDHEFDYFDVVNLWMAQGFVQSEETGHEYFNFLLSASFFQSTEAEFFYKMHDCIHDLAMLASSGECFRIEGEPTCIPATGHRHLFFYGFEDDGTVKWKDLYICKGLRTIIIFDYSDPNKQILSGLFVNLRCLRALVFKCSEITELPDSISNLKHLRYLDLSSTEIRQLPESVSSLYNLQILVLDGCEQLCQLPKETRKLVNLRRLDLYQCLSLKSMPPEIGRLTCLRTLCTFIVGREREDVGYES